MNMQKSKIERLKKKRLIGFIVGIICLVGAYFGFNESYNAHKELMQLDSAKLGESILE